MLYGNGGKNDYISLSFTPNQLNKSINMKSASERYSLLNSMSFQHPIASDISMVTIDYHSLITDGGFIVTRDGDKIEGYAEMTSAATGKKLRIYGTCTYDQQDAERTSFISLNDLKTPLGSAYYQPLEEETISEIHLSPASPVMGALIDQVDEYYVRIRFDNALATAKTPIDITRIDKLRTRNRRSCPTKVGYRHQYGPSRRDGHHHPLQIRPARQLPNLVRSAGS